MGKVIMLRGRDPPRWVVDLNDIKEEVEEEINEELQEINNLDREVSDTYIEYYNDKKTLQYLKLMIEIPFDVVIIEGSDEDYKMFSSKN